MSNTKNERVMEEDRNLIIRAIRLMMSGGRRHSFMERTDKLTEYETALQEGYGEDIVEDLVDYKENHRLLPEQIREAEDLIIAINRRIEELKRLQKEKLEAEELELIDGKRR